MKTHSKVLSAILAGSLAFVTVGAATAGGKSGYQSTFSTIRSMTATSVTLDDGQAYSLPYGFNVSKLHVGERVAVVWTPEKNSSARDASSITVG